MQLPPRASTAFGLFNLIGGVAMLFASVVAGVLWQRVGAGATFYAGAGFGVLAAVLIVSRGRYLTS